MSLKLPALYVAYPVPDTSSLSPGSGLPHPLPAALPLQVLQSLPGAVVVLDASGIVQLVNPAAAQLLRCQPAALLGQPLYAALPAELHEQLQQAGAAGEKFQLEYFEPGRAAWFCWVGVPLEAGLLLTIEDITQAKQARQELQQAYAQLEAIFEAVPAQLGYYQAVRDEQGQLIDLRSVAINRASNTLMQLSDRPGAELMSVLVPGLRELPVWQTITQVVSTGEPQRLELEHRFGNQVRWLDVYYARLGDGLINASLDITARKELEQELRAGKDRLQAVFDSSTLALHVLKSVRDAAGRIIDFEVVLANKAAEVEAQGPVVGRRMLVDWPHSRKVGLFDGIRRTVETGQPLDLEHYFDGDGFQGWFRWTAVKLGDGVASTVENITARKQDTAELLRLERVQQQQLANAVLAAQETERRRIAESLHNGVGQQLYAAQLHLDGLARTDNPAAFAECKSQVLQLLRTAVWQTRDLSHQLIPTELEDFGLVAVLQGICRDFTTPQLRFTCEVGQFPTLPPALELAFYRMAQELANNIVKHAQASEATLHLRAPAGWLELWADDNGRGFSATARPDRGLGLQMLTDRVELLGGTLTIDSSPGYGTQVRIRIPHQPVPLGVGLPPEPGLA
ncbi:sensor histidine kinase [Hymenobacter cellulosilyticus]|uniref:Oxygen sensor histidine kinase NreB n=1 Tax=Hymenobacter cellulosilyticus TaxID=2932248 RepID=A0A8T9Q430_9BACT|nr:PAS domain-containing protein [Hymenobacter cellulosilyticus]UOQ70229.1 PAS domain-containing protein [Hymenobacter cellulosilyticus]